MKNIYFYETKISKIAICEEKDSITNLFFNIPNDLSKYNIKESPAIKKAYLELTEYLEGKRKKFTIKLNPEGTDFMKAVWKELEKVPYGETRTYKDIAISIGDKNKARAVGMANNKNPIPIFIPCHRIIGSNGSLVGYNMGLKLKRFLLEIESKTPEDKQ